MAETIEKTITIPAEILKAENVSYNDDCELGADNTQDAITKTAKIAKGRNQAHVFSTTADMQAWLSKAENAGKYNVGDNLYIVEIDVPDWWVAEVLTEADAETGYYYKIAPLETQKVDLTEIEKEIALFEKTKSAINQASKTWVIPDSYALMNVIYDIGEPDESKYPPYQYESLDNSYVDVLTGKTYYVKTEEGKDGTITHTWTYEKTLESVQGELTSIQSELDKIGTTTVSKINGTCKANTLLGFGNFTVEEEGTYNIEFSPGGYGCEAFNGIYIGITNPGTTTVTYARSRVGSNHITATIGLLKGAVVKGYVNSKTDLTFTEDVSRFYLRTTRIK